MTAALALDVVGGGLLRPDATAAGAPGVRSLPCLEFSDQGPPPRNLRVILGVVALPASPPEPRALQTSINAATGRRNHLFAKEGLWIRSGARFRLIVPNRLRGRLSIGWGNGGEGHVGSTVVDDRCKAFGGAKWSAAPGGYYVREPTCATLIVASGGQRRLVQIGVGKACPGQRPPPNPTSR